MEHEILTAAHVPHTCIVSLAKHLANRTAILSNKLSPEQTFYVYPLEAQEYRQILTASKTWFGIYYRTIGVIYREQL
jgi:hypothetical protein